MMALDIRSNIDEVLARVSEREKAIPVAISNALNTTVFKVRELEVQEMQRVLDRPTRFTLNSLFIERATASVPTARVYLKETWFGRHYLRPNIYGGPRPLKGFEIVLRKAGLLPPGMFAVPGSGAQMDSFGNMSRGELLKVMSALKLAQQTAGFSANRTPDSARRRGRKLAQYFVGRPGKGLPLGVWQSFRFAHGSAVRPILIFVRQPLYSVRYKFEQVAEAVARKSFPLNLERELLNIPTGRSLGI
jgi:hypothetical protein